MRVVALLATYNEERFIAGCIEHLARQQVDVYLIDNGSTDATVPVAEGYRSRGIIGIEHLPRHGVYSWRPILERKEELAATLDADWFMHVDADEVRLPPRSDQTLAEAFADADARGYNAVNFLEFAFVPTRESPDHDHADFQATMRWYYPFLPGAGPNRLNAWKRQPGRVDLAWSGGHEVRFAGIRACPEWFPMRHYMYLSVDHALRKYVQRTYDAGELDHGWHRARAALRADQIVLPSDRELRVVSDAGLDGSNPRTRHYLFLRGAGDQP